MLISSLFPPLMNWIHPLLLSTSSFLRFSGCEKALDTPCLSIFFFLLEGNDRKENFVLVCISQQPMSSHAFIKRLTHMNSKKNDRKRDKELLMIYLMWKHMGDIHKCLFSKPLSKTKNSFLHNQEIAYNSFRNINIRWNWICVCVLLDFKKPFLLTN